MFGWLFVTRRFIDHLESEVEWLRSEARYEKARADRALDQLATLRVGAPVTTAYPAPPPELPPPPSDQEITKLLQSTEFSQAGVG